MLPCLWAGTGSVSELTKERDKKANEAFSQYSKDKGMPGRADPPEGSLKRRCF